MAMVTVRRTMVTVRTMSSFLINGQLNVSLTTKEKGAKLPLNSKQPTIDSLVLLYHSGQAWKLELFYSLSLSALTLAFVVPLLVLGGCEKGVLRDFAFGAIYTMVSIKISAIQNFVAEIYVLCLI